MGRPGLSLDRKFKRLARDLDEFQVGFGKVLARGALELLWDAAYESCTDEIGDVADIEAAAEWHGAPGRLTRALVEAGGPGRSGFIEEGGSQWWPEGAPGTYRIHDLWDHAPDYAGKRLKREAEREAKGKTLRDLRAEAGRKGAQATNAKRRASVEQADGKRPTLDDGDAATIRQVACTPAPAPAPAPDACSLASAEREHTLAPEAATAAPPLEAASGAVSTPASVAACSDGGRGVGQRSANSAKAGAGAGAFPSQPEAARQEVSDATGPGKPATHPSAADEATPPVSSAAAAPRRAAGPVVDDLPHRPLLLADVTELPQPAADVRAELERQIGKTLALAGREDFAAQVERLEREEEGLALRECTAAACELFDREGKMPGSLEWFARAMAKRLGPTTLGAPPPLPGPDPAWLKTLGERRVKAEAQWDLVLKRVTGPLSGVYPDHRREVLERELTGLVSRFTEPPVQAVGGATC